MVITAVPELAGSLHKFCKISSKEAYGLPVKMSCWKPSGALSLDGGLLQVLVCMGMKGA